MIITPLKWKNQVFQKQLFLQVQVNVKWEWLRMPFGLKNVPRSYSKAMLSALSGLIGISCFAYLDDFIVYSNF